MPLFIHDEPARTSVEPEDIVNEPPHLRIEQAGNLAEYGGEVLAGPFEESSVPGDTECHLSGEDGDAWPSLEESEKIGVRGGVHDDLGTRPGQQSLVSNVEENIRIRCV